MTKQQAYELASKEFPIVSIYSEVIYRSMEIYAAAFAEWGQHNDFYIQTKSDAENVWVDALKMDLKEYTTAELLIEFEKNK